MQIRVKLQSIRNPNRYRKVLGHASFPLPQDSQYMESNVKMCCLRMQLRKDSAKEATL